MSFKAVSLGSLKTSTCLAFVSALVVAFASSAFALEPTDKWEGSINYAATGGTFLEDTCQATSFGCFPGEPDGQGDSVTSISTATLSGSVNEEGTTIPIPPDANVVKAYLVWMGSIEHNYGEDNPVTPPDNELSLQPPNGKKYPVVGTASDIEEIVYEDIDVNDEKVTLHFYTYRIDITEIMQQHTVTEGKPLTGDYTVSDFSGFAGEPYRSLTLGLGGWSVLIVYSSAKTDARRIYLYQDFTRIRDNIVELMPEGFQVPEEPDAKVTFFTGEGDPGISGMGSSATHPEQLRFNNSLLFDDCNSEDNPFNGTVNTNSAGICRENQYSIDLDTFDVSNTMLQGDESAVITYSVGQDEVFTNYMIIAINTKLPDFDIPGEPEKIATPEAGSAVSPGQEFYYEIVVQNCGEDLATYVKVRDRLPREVTYVANSTILIKPDGSEVPISDPSSEISPIEAGVDISDALPPGPDNRHRVKWRVRLNSQDQGVTKETVVNNIGEIVSGAGDVYFTNGGVPVSHTVQLQALEGKLNFSRGPAQPSTHFVKPGDTGVTVAHLGLQALEGNVEISAVRFTPPEEEATDHLMISKAHLYKDVDKDGRVTDNDTLLGEAGWSGGGIYFGGLSSLGQIIEGDKIYLLMTVDISDQAAAGNIAWLQLLDDNAEVRGFKQGLPFNTGTVRIANEDTDLTFQLGRNNPTVFFLSAGAVESVMQVQFNAFADVTLESLMVGTLGTLYDPTELVYLDMYDDSNSNGKYDDGETKLGSVTFGSDDGVATYEGLGYTISSGSEKNIVFLAGFDPNTAVGKVFSLVVENNDWLGVGGMVVEGAPLQGPEFEFIDDVVQSCEKDEDCESLGYGYICDEIAGICRPDDNGGWEDGDSSEDGDWDGVVDGDDDEKEDGGGGCMAISDLHTGGLLILSALLLLFCLWRMRGGRVETEE